MEVPDWTLIGLSLDWLLLHGSPLFRLDLSNHLLVLLLVCWILGTGCSCSSFIWVSSSKSTTHCELPHISHILANSALAWGLVGSHSLSSGDRCLYGCWLSISLFCLGLTKLSCFPTIWLERLLSVENGLLLSAHGYLVSSKGWLMNEAWLLNSMGSLRVNPLLHLSTLSLWLGWWEGLEDLLVFSVQLSLLSDQDPLHLFLANILGFLVLNVSEFSIVFFDKLFDLELIQFTPVLALGLGTCSLVDLERVKCLASSSWLFRSSCGFLRRLKSPLGDLLGTRKLRANFSRRLWPFWPGLLGTHECSANGVSSIIHPTAVALLH